jgi:hypothetical protein
MVTNGATRGSTKDTMVTGNMPGNTANDGPLNASLGLSIDCERKKRSRHYCARDNLGHVVLQKLR